MSWYNEEGPKNDVVVSTRVRYARNLMNYKFPSKMASEDSEKLINEVYDCFINSNKSFADQFKLVKNSEITKESLLALFEKHLVSREFASQQLVGGCIISNDETFSMMLCEEDHIRLQVILPGCQIKEALKTATDYENLLSGRLPFARCEKLGYLTSCPTNVGNGLRISVMLHLPALTISRRIGRVLNSVGKLGLTVRGMYGEGTGAGICMYQLSNQITLGITPEETAKRVEEVVDRIIELETETRKMLLTSREIETRNRCQRAYGMLTNSYAITSEEMLSCLSDVRLGKSLGLLDINYSDVSKLLVECSYPCLAEKFKLHEPSARDMYRAKYAREIL